MQITIDEKVIEKTLSESATAAVRDAASSYQVRSAIEERVAKAVLEGVMSEALTAAIDKIDVAALSTALCQQLQKSVIAGAVAIIQDSVIDQILRLRKVPDYDDAKRSAARREIEYQVFGRKDA